MAASVHAGCERFRLTDPLITRVSRRALAAQLGFADVGAGIPEARWGVAILGLGIDHTVDPVARTVTFREPPPEGTLVAFRYRTDG